MERSAIRSLSLKPIPQSAMLLLDYGTVQHLYTDASESDAHVFHVGLVAPGLPLLARTAPEQLKIRPLAARLDQRVILVGVSAVLALAGLKHVDLAAAGGVRACLARTPNRISSGTIRKGRPGPSERQRASEGGRIVRRRSGRNRVLGGGRFSRGGRHLTPLPTLPRKGGGLSRAFSFGLGARLDRRVGWLEVVAN